MAKPVWSKLRFEDLSDISDLLYLSCVCDLLENDKVQKLDNFYQHCNTSRLQHSLNVSYYSFLICKRFGWDYRSAARAGLLHDMFFYDWRKKSALRTKNHASWHPHVALDNAKKITNINKIEKDAILKHMWPTTAFPPLYKESYVVNFVDKISAVLEVAENKVLKRASDSI